MRITHLLVLAAGDVWSFGVVVWELLTEQEPYHGLLPVQIGVGGESTNQFSLFSHFDDGVCVCLCVCTVLQEELSLDLNVVLPGAPPLLVEMVRATQLFDPKYRPAFAALREQLETLVPRQ